MRRHLAVTLALVTAAVTGCGSASSGGTVSVQPGGGTGSQPAPAPAPIGNTTPSPDPLRSQPPQAQGSPHPLASTSDVLPRGTVTTPIPWRFVATRDGGRTVEIEFEVGGCERFDHVEVSERPASVQIAVLGSSPTDRHQACPAIAQIINGTVSLHRPLGDRTLLHAPVSRS
jgi:hypothetical protein